MPDAGPCSRGVIEDDFESSPWLGPDTENGELNPLAGTSIVATTFALITPGAEDDFNVCVGAITEQIMMSAGVRAIRFGSSAECGVGRTITLWEDLPSMMDFAFSGAHVDAIGNASSVTLPGSATTQYTGDSQEDVTWEAAAEQLASIPPY